MHNPLRTTKDSVFHRFGSGRSVIRALLHEVHYSDASRHILHKLSLHFVSAFAQLELSKTGFECVALQLVETGHTLKVIERERRTFLWTSAPSTLPWFQLRYDVQHEVDGFHSLCSLPLLFLSRMGVARHAALCFSVLGGSLGCCLQ